MEQKLYPGSQQELYTVCLLGWQSCQQHLSAFSAFKPKYTAAFVDARVQEVKDAMNLPDFQTRDAVSETFLVELRQLARTAMDAWLRLRLYINDAFAPAFQKPKQEAAGQSYFAKAGDNHWDSVRALMVSGMNFIDNNLAALTANDNMPPAFQNDFKTAKLDFESKQQEFLDSEEGSVIGTVTKIRANNDCFTKLRSMFADGQEIFKNDEAIKRQFVYEQVAALATGTGTAGFKGTVTDETKGLPIANVSLEMENGKQTTTDEDGKYAMTQLAAGTYAVTITAEGYQTKTETIEVKTGTTSTLNVVLVKL